MKSFSLFALVVFIFLSISLKAAGPIKKGLKLLEKGKIEKLEKHLQKILEKDSVHAGARYVYSLLFTDTSYRHFSIDTAYIFIEQALSDFANDQPKQLAKIKKEGLDSVKITTQKETIHRLAFERTQKADTLEAYNYFLQTFVDAHQINEVTERRNEIAFQQALDENTYESFSYFLSTYPQARQVKDAREFYDILLYKEKTRDGSLLSYRQFLIEFPASPYRKEAEKQVLLLSTDYNRLQNLQQFLTNYPQSVWKNKVLKLLYYEYDLIESIDEFFQLYKNEYITDSLSQAFAMRQDYWVTLLEKGRFGFMNSTGSKVIEPIYYKVDEDYLCGDIKDELILVETAEGKQLITRNGSPALPQYFEKIKVLKGGIVFCEAEDEKIIYHLSGHEIVRGNWNQACLIGNDFLAIQIKKQWSLYSKNGRQLILDSFDSIYQQGQYILIEKNKKIAILPINNLESKINTPEFIWEEAEVYAEHYIKAFDERDHVALMDPQGNIPIRAERDIQKTPNGWIIKNNQSQYYLTHTFGSTYIDNAQLINWNTSFIGIKNQAGKWEFNTHTLSLFPKYRFDSLALVSNHLALGFTVDSILVHYQSGNKIAISKTHKIRFRQAPNATSDAGEYVEVINEKGFRRIYNHYGNEILAGIQEEVSILPGGYLIIEKKGKKGLIDSLGNQVLAPKYENLGNFIQGTVAVLEKRQFGLYHILSKKLIPVEYERLIKPYSNQLFIAVKNGNSMFINLENRQLGDIQFTEALYYSDTVALITTEQGYLLWNIVKQQVVYGPFDNYKIERWDTDEIRLQIYKDRGYGIYSNRFGEVVAPTFNDLINIGQKEKPLYFAEKHVSEADFYVVLYLNAQGETLRKQVFSPKDYDLIYCD